MKKQTAGSTVLEYAFLIAIIISTLLVMSVYIKRNLQGKWRSVGDQFGSGRQYEPGVSESYNFTPADEANWAADHPNWSAPF